MINEKIEIEVYGRKLTVEVEGLTQLEMNSLAQQLTEKMTQIARESEIVDSSKLSILTALEIMAERFRIDTQKETMHRAEERLMEQMVSSLQSALAAAPEPVSSRKAP